LRFLADMGMDVRVVEWLRAAGHDATHLRDENLHRLPDEDIFTKAVAERRVILAFDLDFGEIAAMASGHVTSVVLFRLRNTRRTNVIRRLEIVLRDFMEPLESRAVVLVEESRIRVRPLPLKR